MSISLIITKTTRGGLYSMENWTLIGWKISTVCWNRNSILRCLMEIIYSWKTYKRLFLRPFRWNMLILVLFLGAGYCIWKKILLNGIVYLMSFLKSLRLKTYFMRRVGRFSIICNLWGFCAIWLWILYSRSAMRMLWGNLIRKCTLKALLGCWIWFFRIILKKILLRLRLILILLVFRLNRGLLWTIYWGKKTLYIMWSVLALFRFLGTY